MTYPILRLVIMHRISAVCAAAALIFSTSVNAQESYRWTGDDLNDNSWDTAANWEFFDPTANDGEGDWFTATSAPAFDGTERILFNNFTNIPRVPDSNTGFRTTDMGGDRIIHSLDFGDGAGTYYRQLTGDAGSTLVLRQGNILLRSHDGRGEIFQTNIRMDAGVGSGSYVADWRQWNNARGDGGGFHGAITQAAGEHWTVEFNRQSARGNFFLRSPDNNISVFRVGSGHVFSMTPGALGGTTSLVELANAGGSLTFAGGDQYNNPVQGGFLLTANGTLAANVATRFAGDTEQGNFTLSYGGTSLFRLTSGDMTGTDTGATTITGSVAFAPQRMTQLASGTLNIGTSSAGARSAFVLSADETGGTPTWAEFTAARSYDQAGGTGTWRIDNNANSNNASAGGGFAARGGDIVIPNDANTTSATFARNFSLGSSVSVDGQRYANGAIRIEQDVAFASNMGIVRWTPISNLGGTDDLAANRNLNGPVHEMSGVISGGSETATLSIMGTGSLTGVVGGILRISNPGNTFQVANLVIGGHRHMADVGIGGFGNADDASGQVAIFSNNAAFGNPGRILVAAGGDSSRTAAMLLLEDQTGAGQHFDRNIQIQATNETRAGTFGSYQGDVTYSGNLTLLGRHTAESTAGTPGVPGTGSANLTPLHVHSGRMTFTEGASIDNQRMVNADTARVASLYKSGEGVLQIDAVDLQGAFSWDVRAGALIYNTDAAPVGGYTASTVRSGATLGGDGTITMAEGATLSLQAGATISPGNSSGTLTIDGDFSFAQNGIYVWEIDANGNDTLDVLGQLTFASGTKHLHLVNLGGNLQVDQEYVLFQFGTLNSIDNAENGWNFTYNSAELAAQSTPHVFVRDNQVLVTGVIPEPTTVVLLVTGLMALVHGRRRSRR